MAYFISSPGRVGRSQGASIFWGLISVCFAAAACYYYWENHRNEAAANLWRDQAQQFQEDNESLKAQKEHLQASKVEAEAQLKTREDLIQEKETQLAAEETRLEGLGNKSQSQSQQNLAQVPMVRRFNDVIRKLGKDTPPDVVERGGRPVLRVPNGQLFAAGTSTLTPDGKAMLSQIAQGVVGIFDGYEMRVVCYTDTDAEASTPAAPDAKKDPNQDLHGPSWDLTAARATALARFFRDQTQLPPLGVIVLPRGDADPIVSNTGDNRARNRRTEIYVMPQPPAFHAPEVEKVAAPADASPPADAAPVVKKPVKKPDKPVTDKPAPELPAKTSSR